MRLGRQVATVIHSESVPFQIGKMIRLRDGNGLAIIATGNMVEQVLLAAESLAKDGIQARVLDCHTIKPIDIEREESRVAGPLRELGPGLQGIALSLWAGCPANRRHGS